MSSIIISILVVVCIFAGGLIGLSLNHVLRPSHLTKETQEVVRIGIVTPMTGSNFCNGSSSRRPLQ